MKTAFQLIRNVIAATAIGSCAAYAAGPGPVIEDSQSPFPEVSSSEAPPSIQLERDWLGRPLRLISPKANFSFIYESGQLKEVLSDRGERIEIDAIREVARSMEADVAANPELAREALQENIVTMKAIFPDLKQTLAWKPGMQARFPVSVPMRQSHFNRCALRNVTRCSKWI